MTDVLNTRIMGAVIRRDLRLLISSRTTLIPMIVLPLVIFAALPALVAIAPSAINLPVDDLTALTATLPDQAVEGLPVDPDDQLKVVLLVHLLAPMVLIVPMVLAIVAAAGAIAGERERRTLETLLLSPISDQQLFLAKTAGAWLPAMAITLVGGIVYQVAATVALSDTGLRPFPNLTWTLLLVWVAPAIAAAALGAVVIISARARTYQDAMQTGGLLVLPVVAIVVAQSAGVLTLGPLAITISGAVLWAGAAVLLRAGAHALHRNRLTPQL